jgi:ABC-type dipeptide/oligopeptide/nickel transport system permease subunit
LPLERISLGGIVRDGQELLYNGWWVSVGGGLAIVIIVTSLNLAADWLRTALDPTRRGHA